MNLGSWKEVLGVLIVICVISSTYYVYSINATGSDYKNEQRAMIYQVEEARRENARLQRLLEHDSKCTPSMEGEVMTKRVYNDVIQMGRRMTSELIKIKDNSNQLLEDFKLQHRAMLAHVKELISTNEEWRRRENERLMLMIRNRINFVQNPVKCETSKRLVCKLNADGCGFGCQLHHLLYCFLISYGTGRTLIIDSDGWNYSKKGWQAAFLPVSQTCTTTTGAKIEPWRGETENADSLVVSVPAAVYLPISNPPPYRPLAIPYDISHDLMRLHAYPPLWWNAQFIRYLWRLQPWLQLELEKAEQLINFKQPIVGIHVRRTDKLIEDSPFYSIDLYMKHVEEWFKTYQLQYGDVKKRVFLASDDPTALIEARKKYADYEFFGDPSISETAQVNSRYTQISLFGLIKDIQFLSKSHYLVCAFSSNVCRLAYELMQTWVDSNGDATHSFRSLDRIYHFDDIAHPQEQIVKLPHKPVHKDELELRIGDRVRVIGNHWDGFAVGINVQTGKKGRFPSYKAENIFSIVKYPTYEQGTR